MDDRNFDDLLKSKLKDYEDPTYDASALEGLHERLNSFQPAPWYASSSMRIAFISSLFLLTAINTYFFIHNANSNGDTLRPLSKASQAKSAKIDSLNTVIAQLLAKQERQTPVANLESGPLASPKFQLNLSKEESKNDHSAMDVSYQVGLGPKENIPVSMYTRLEEDGLLREKDGEIFLMVPKQPKISNQTALHTRLSDLLAPTDEHRPTQLLVLSASVDKKKTPHNIPAGKTSLAARNALEKHYFNKLGIQLAPHMDLVKSIFEQGSGAVTPRVGLTADWLVSPRFSIESGIDYTTTKNKLSHNDIPPYVQSNPQLGSCEQAILTNQLVSIPLSLKYRQWVSDKSQLVLRAGYTPYEILGKQTQYNYARPDIYSPDVDRTTTLNSQHETRYFGSTVTSSAGITIKRDKNKGTWEAALYYEHSLGRGFDQPSMQLLGLRTAYWFKVR